MGSYLIHVDPVSTCRRGSRNTALGHVRRVPFMQRIIFIMHPGILASYVGGRQLELEFHVAYDPSETFDPAQNDGLRARIEHVVFRAAWYLDGSNAFVDDHIRIGVFRPMEAPLLQLPRLRTVTVEATDEGDLALVAAQLPRLHADGKLHLRTCKEGDELRKAERAKWEKARASSEKLGVEGAKDE